jgi:hypothetical protein
LSGTDRGTSTQAEARDEIVAAGGTWAVAKGLDAALEQLKAWGAIR